MARATVMVAHCGRCCATWAIDFQPDGCMCDEFRPHPDDDVRPIEADDYHAALDLCPWDTPNPQPQQEVDQ